MIDHLAAARAFEREIVEFRRATHARPELGRNEHETAARIERALDAHGIAHSRPFGTAVVAEIGESGPIVGIRADIDALPVSEATGCDFASTVEGISHACGHDVHAAGALGAAMILNERRDDLRGRARIFFEPDEEGNGGAANFVNAGLLDGVVAVFGAHVSPDVPLGKIGVRRGKFYAASDTFDITITGRSAHGAEPERGVDALAAAASAVCALKKIPARSSDRCVVTVGTLRSGSARNVIADRAELSGIIRTLGKESREATRRAVVEEVERAAKSFGASADVRLTASYGGVVNTDRETELVRSCAIELFGDRSVVDIDEPTMTTEDFGVYIDASSGSFYHIGAGSTSPVHSPTFLPDDSAAVIAAALHALIVERYLESCV